jgi:hypothetical protein
MPTDKSVAEKELQVAREQARDAQVQMQDAQRTRDLLAASTHALLAARGWTRVHGNYRLGDDARSYGLLDALRSELGRDGSASQDVTAVFFPVPAELEERVGVFLAVGEGGEALLRQARRLQLERGVHDLASLAGAILCACLAPRFVSEQRGRVGLEVVDLFLAANGHRLSGEEDILRSLVQETLSMTLDQEQFAAGQLAPLIVQGPPQQPFAARYPELGLRD